MSKGTILVTGGAGYIGSCAALCLHEAGYQPVVLDNLTTGHRELVKALEVPFVEGDTASSDLISDLCRRYRPKAAMHFAANALVGESESDPQKYYLNNVAASLELISTLRACGVTKFVFSSTCATYGNASPPIAETTQQNPINAYGRSKLMVEQALADYARAYSFSYIAFRYFNVAGTHPSLRVGEWHSPETHLIPRAIFAAHGIGELKVFGTDYPTPDGTCIRDYVHVIDIASAHIKGLEYLLSGGRSDVFNIGTGKGHSVKEVIAAVERASGKTVPWAPHARRVGDPPALVAEADKIGTALGWRARHSELELIVKSALQWYQANPALMQL